MRHADAVVLVDGDPLPAALLPDLAEAVDRAALTVAADGGLHHAHRADRDVDVVIGDLDSAAPEALLRARSSGAAVLPHPVDKDATDLELALDLVQERLTGAEDPRVLVIGGQGGRTDHLLGNLLVLTADRYAALHVTAWLGADILHVVRGERSLRGTPGSIVSILAMHGAASGVTTHGLRYPLEDAMLTPGSSIGISNRLTGDAASIKVSDGVLAVIQSTQSSPVGSDL